MASGGRRVLRRSQRNLWGNCVIFGLTFVTCLGFLVFLFHVFSVVLHPVVQPTSVLRQESFSMHVVEVQLPTPALLKAIDHDEVGFDGNAEDDVELILQAKENSGFRSTVAKEGAEQLVRDGGEEVQQLVSRVAFGSCTAKRPIEQPIWREGVIRSDPHAWIWGGDLAYMDWPDVNCKETPNHQQCNCSRNWVHSNRQTCLSGDISHAKKKLAMQMQNSDYMEFLEYMCPNAKGNSNSMWGDLARCSRPVIGTWDDHDYNWQDGDRRLPTKEQQKHIFLDAFGVPNNSPRRTPGRGIYWKHTLNQRSGGKEIDVLLLDERFHRDNNPCETRREVCEKACLVDPRKYKHDWCKDFLLGGKDGKGSCCRKDEQIWKGWCKLQGNTGNDLWEAACNPKSQIYGSSDLAVDIESGEPVRKRFNSSTEYDDGIMCEVLGQDQRSWLQDELYNSNALLKLVVSGSPSFNNPGQFVCSRRTRKLPEVNCTCYDDYDCFRPAQLNLLHNLANAPGCVVVLTGDFHFSDIKMGRVLGNGTCRHLHLKNWISSDALMMGDIRISDRFHSSVLRPGRQSYTEAYESFDLPHPIFQVMASGLTTETGQKAECSGYRVDNIGMRPGGECSFVSGPAFGMIEIDWDSPEKIAKLQVRDDQGVVKLESILSLNTCTEIDPNLVDCGAGLSVLLEPLPRVLRGGNILRRGLIDKVTFHHVVKKLLEDNWPSSDCGLFSSCVKKNIANCPWENFMNEFPKQLRRVMGHGIYSLDLLR